MKKVYFPGLNSLRFYAALLVVLYHINNTLARHHIIGSNNFALFNRADEAVSFFFCLSGFLITFLLLNEQHYSGKISVRKFYLRRILRIWPLYFLVITVGMLFYNLVLPFLQIDFNITYRPLQGVLLYLFFLPHYMSSFHDVGMILGPTWSIGVEEQFYLLWAPLFLLMSGKILKPVIGIMILNLAIIVVFSYNPFHWSNKAVYFVYTFRFHYMAAGALMAILLFRFKDQLLEYLIFTSKFIQLTLFAALLYYFVFYNHFLRSYVHWIFEEVVMMALFSWLIVNIAANPNNVLKISNRLTEYLGKISYGIYLYHCIVITLVVYVFQKLNLTGSPNLGVIVFYALVFLLTFVVSALSYTYFESKFLLLKKKFRQASS